MATKKRGLIQRLFGSKKMSFDNSIECDDDDVATLHVFQASSALGRRHTVDVETFRGDVSDEALMAAASKRAAQRQTSGEYQSPIGRLVARVMSHDNEKSPIGGAPVVEQRQRRPGVVRQHPKPTAKPTAKPALPPRTSSEKTSKNGPLVDLSTDTDDDGQIKSGSFRRRVSRRDRLLRWGPICKVDTSQPIVYPTTPETILEYHKALPFLDENEEWLMVELNEYECLVDSLEIIKIIAKHSKFFEVEPDELWEEFFEFVDDVPAYDEVINFDVWQEFRDKKYTC